MKITIENCLIFFICLFLLVLPGFPQLGAIGLGISIFFSIIIHIKNKTFSGLRNNLVLLGSFYVLHLIGVLYSNNVEFALLDIQIKASFLLVPFFFDKLNFNFKQVQVIKFFFIFGCLSYSLFLLTNAFIEFYKSNTINQFFYTEFSPKQHVAYLTMYIILSCFFIFDLIKAKYQANKKNIVLEIVVLFFFYIIMVLLSSRTAFFSALLTTSLYLFLTFKSVFKAKFSILVSVFNGLLLIIIFQLLTGSQNRFMQSGDAQTSEITKTQTTETSSTVLKNVRFMLWTSAFELFKEHPILGVGTGDIKDELMKKYEQLNFSEGITFNLNSHNQFFQTLATLGILGLMSMLAIFIIPCYQAIKKGNYLFLSFLIMVFINCLTESVFEKQAGVMFFCFFFIFLQYRNYYETSVLNE